MKKKVLSFIMIIIAGLIFSAASFEAPPESEDLSGKRVLFISSYCPSYETFFYQVNGIKSVLDKRNISLDIEFMDSKRFYTEENFKNFYRSLKYKLDHGKAYDAIMVGDDNALLFVNHCQDLFEGLPTVFLGINDIDMARTMGAKDNVTGVVESLSFKGTLELASLFQGQAKRVVALTDATTTGQGVYDAYLTFGHTYGGFDFDVIDLTDLSFDEFTSQLSFLSSDDIILLLSVHRDKTGKTVTFNEGVKMVLDSVDQPVYTLYEFGLGTGLIGGDVVSYHQQGKRAGQLVLDILYGKKFDQMKVIENPPLRMLDYAVMNTYNFDPDIVEGEVIYINKQENLWMKYLPYISLGLVVVSFQFMLIIYLFRNIKYRQDAEKDLLESKQGLIRSNGELMTLNEDMYVSNQELKVTNKMLSQALDKIECQNREIYDLLYLDDLTDLKNRKAILDLAKGWIEDEDHAYYGMMFLDVDNFKFINDTFGHDFGDKIIIETGRRLMALEGDQVKIGRFGGDEFLLIHRHPDLDRVTNFLMTLEGVFNEPMRIENMSLYLTVSIGLSICPLHGRSLKELIKKADMALYEAKKSGKNRSVIYNRHMDVALEDKVLFQSHVRKAYNNKEFYMNYQPYYDLSKKRFIGAEALIRWKSPELGFVSPLKLIQASEEMGLIVDIGKWVLEESCLFSRRLNEEADERLVVSINISSVQMLHPNFIHDLDEVLNKTGVDPKTICLEMTETSLFELNHGNELIIDQIRARGLVISLDDFGTGYSSLSYFKKLPASTLKIDKLFIEHIVDNDFDRHTVQMIINLAHYRGMSVIAEGVEDHKQVDMLRQMKCDIIQGYYYSKPLCPHEARERLVNKQVN